MTHPVPVAQHVQFNIIMITINSILEGWQNLTGDKLPEEEIPFILDFNPRRGIMTRYGKKLLREGAKYYSKISIKDLIDDTD